MAVIDWEDAAIGDPLADVANARLELTWAIGLEAMEDFIRQYGSNVTAVESPTFPTGICGQTSGLPGGLLIGVWTPHRGRRCGRATRRLSPKRSQG
jgi:hypothetical protein